MIAYTIDNPPPATIILITSENIYSYAVSILRLRRYRVVVITPPGTVLAQASVHLDWNSEILRAPLEELNPPKAPQPTSRQRVDPIPHTPSTSRTQYMTDDDEVVDNDMYGTYGKSGRGSTSYSTHINGTGFPFVSQQYSKPPSGRQTPAHQLAQPKSSPPATFQSAKSNSPSPPVACKTPEPVFVTEGNGLFESSTRTPNLPKGFPYSESESRTGTKQPSFSNISITESSSPSSIFHPLAATSNAYELPKTPPPTGVPKPTSDPSTPATKPALPMTLPLKSAAGASSPATSSVPKAALGPTSQTADLKTNQGLSSTTRSHPPYFMILAQKLQSRCEVLGQPRIPRTDIGNELAKHKSVYAQAGVASFAAFINMAHAAGVVEVGGSGNDQWVSLRPGWPAGTSSR